MNRFTLLQLATSLGIAVAAFATPASAQEFCRIDNPKVTGAADSARLTLRIACQTARSANTVRYPAGRLYLGVTLYKVENAGLRNFVVPVVEGIVEPTYVKPIDIERTGPSAIVDIALGNLADNTHILVAIWDKKTPCAADNPSKGCTVAGATLGDVDSFELPIPVDVWPRPICDIQQLTSRGFFNWVKTEGEFGGPMVPDRYASMLQANDCFMRFADRPGLGFSVRRWRAQPLPRT